MYVFLCDILAESWKQSTIQSNLPDLHLSLKFSAKKLGANIDVLRDRHGFALLLRSLRNIFESVTSEG